MSPACSRHRALVDRALSDDASPDDLARYADEVAECAECRRLLAVDLQVHPAVLDQAGQSGWDALAASLPPTAGERELLAAVKQRPPRPWLRWAAPAMLAAAAVLVAIGSFDSPPQDLLLAPVPPRALAPSPDATLTAPSVPAPSEAAAPVAPPSTPELPVAEVPEAAPAEAAPPPAVAVAPRPTPDWSPPAFVDLVGTRPKGNALTTRDLRLELDGTPAAGASVYLAVAATAESRLAVCVSGPERGVVWRGSLPPGRIDLSVDGRRQAFAFGEAGVYTFAVSTTDYVECTDPVHVVEVEVR